MEFMCEFDNKDFQFQSNWNEVLREMLHGDVTWYLCVRLENYIDNCYKEHGKWMTSQNQEGR